MAEDNTETQRYTLTPIERMRCGIRAAGVFGDIENLINQVLSGTLDWVAAWDDVRQPHYVCHLTHSKFDIEFDLVCDGSNWQFTRAYMGTVKYGTYHSDLMRAVTGQQPHIPELVLPMVEKYGLVSDVKGYKPTRNIDNPKRHDYKMRDEFRRQSEEFGRRHVECVGDLIGNLIKQLSPRMPNQFAKALACIPTPGPTQGYLAVFELALTQTFLRDWIEGILERSRFWWYPFTEWLDGGEFASILWITGPNQDPQTVAHVFLRPVAETGTRVEIDMPVGEVEAALVADVLEEICTSLNVDIDGIQIQIQDEHDPFGSAGVAAREAPIGASVFVGEPIKKSPRPLLRWPKMIDDYPITVDGLTSSGDDALPPTNTPKEDTPPAPPSEQPTTADDPRLDWLGELRDREILAMHNSGWTYKEIGAKHHLSGDRIGNMIYKWRRVNSEAVRRKK